MGQKFPKFFERAQAWHAAFITVGFCTLVDVLLSGFGIIDIPKGRLDSTIVVTSFAYAALVAIIYSTWRFADRFDSPQDLSREKANGVIRAYSLLLQAGFFAFAAFGITLMFDISKGLGDKYRLAEAVLARSQELTEVRCDPRAARNPLRRRGRGRTQPQNVA